MVTYVTPFCNNPLQDPVMLEEIWLCSRSWQAYHVF